MQNNRYNLQRFENKFVNFLVCGTQKGGTTTLDFYLRQHDNLCMANRKEVHFFDKDVYFRKPKLPNYSKYHSFFSLKSSHNLIGESTPIYMYWYEAPKRIWEYNPDMKLILILRNPIERAYSHWNMEYSRGKENLSFFDAIKNEEKRCRKALPKQHRIYSYVDRGFYLDQIKRLWFFFPKNQVIIIKNEDLRKNNCETLNKICDFLNIDQFKTVEQKEKNSRKYQSKITDDEINFLKSIYEYDIKGLERELGWDCSNWL